MIKLRPATLGDAKILFEWKNDPIVRKYAIKTHDKIKWEDHLNWLVEHFDEIAIIEDDGVNVGSIRTIPDIAIIIDEKHRKKGIALKALSKVVEDGMLAKIVEGNLGSMRLFIDLGFKPISWQKGYYIFKKE